MAQPIEAHFLWVGLKSNLSAEPRRTAAIDAHSHYLYSANYVDAVSVQTFMIRCVASGFILDSRSPFVNVRIYLAGRLLATSKKVPPWSNGITTKAELAGMLRPENGLWTCSWSTSMFIADKCKFRVSQPACYKSEISQAFGYTATFSM